MNSILITDFYTVVLGDDLNYILLHSLNHNNFIKYDHTNFEEIFPSDSYKYIVKLN